MLVLGGSGIQGAKVHGHWPGLHSDLLEGPGDLPVTTDYRNVLAEILANRARNPNITAVFPGLTYQPLESLMFERTLPAQSWLSKHPKPGIIGTMASGQIGPILSETSDEALAERVRATGDTNAFAILVTRYRGRLIALSRRMLSSIKGGSDEAEDIAQEAFVAAYQKRGSFRSGAQFRPWLYRIAVNRCLDRLRAAGRRPQMDDFEAIPEAEAITGDPMEALLTDERETRLSRAVAALPAKYRAVFLLRHLDDLSYEEIAIAIDLPVGTVKSHLFRARAQLRQSLSGYLDTTL